MKWSISRVAILSMLTVVIGAVAGLLLLGPLARQRQEPKANPSISKSATSPRPAREGPAVWAIVVGIDRYQDESIPVCHGAVADARAVASWFEEAAGWGVGNVLLMDDLGASAPGRDPNWSGRLAPTLANLDWASRHWLARRARPGDVAVVYFAGQAAPRASGDDRKAQAVLLPIDARPDSRGWAIDETIDVLTARGVGPVVCWLDTSPIGRGGPVVPKVEGGRAGGDLLRSLTRWPGTTAWLAAEGGASAEAPAVGSRSPFTAALLEGLGTPRRPKSLLATLDAMNRDPALLSQGFRALGGIDAGLNLWSAEARLRGLASRQLLLQSGHALGVTAIAFTPDGDRMVTGGGDSTLRLWRASDRTLLRAFSTHLVGVTALSLSPDGRFLVSGDGSGRVKLWDFRDRVEVVTGPPLGSGIEVAAFLPDGSRFATFEHGGAIRLHEAAPSRPPLILSRAGRALAVASSAGPIALALADDSGKVLTFDATGRPLGTTDGPGGIVTSQRLATDGRRLAVGDDSGRLIVREIEGDREPVRRDFGRPIGALAFGPGGILVAGAGEAIHRIGGPGGGGELPISGPVDEVALSIDGRWMAARTRGGDLRLWHVEGPGLATPVVPAGIAEAGPFTAIAFAPGGGALVAGEQDGGLRTWDLPGGEARPRIPPRRGQVAKLGVSDDGRHLLQVTRDRVAQVWDLQQGRAVNTIPGSWSSGAISPGGETLALIDQASGELALVDRESGLPRPPRFLLPASSEGCRFGVVSFDPKGQFLAAGSVDAPSEGPLACVWDARDGRLLHALRGHEEPHRLTAVDFSADSRRLLTASEDGTVRVWDLSGKAETPSRILHATDPRTGRAVAIRSARFRPNDSGRVVAGTLDGRVLDWGAGRDEPAVLADDIPGEVRAVAFTRDGQWLAAAGGADRSVRVWELGSVPRPFRLEPAPNHAEVVNDLIGWPGGDRFAFASGSDDATVRLWGLVDRRLLATLSAEQGTPDWVIYTPEGLFDSSPGGEKRVSWRLGDDLISLEQEYDRSHVFRLGDRVRKVQRPKPPAPPPAPPPRLSIDPPAAADAPRGRLTLTIRVDEPVPADLRLYRDGIPVRGAEDFQVEPGRRSVSVAVQLQGGTNRFHAMGSRPGSIDGRSNMVEVHYHGPVASGRVQVLALGVSHYDREGRSLRFADADAEEMAKHLHEHGIHPEGGPGERIVLTNEQVTEEAVAKAFLALRDKVAGHPEDTVVVFLAGHTEVLARRFHLLLPAFPFPSGTVGMLDVAPGTTLPFAAIYRNLSRLDALRRVVVIDACQAQEIHNDPAVLRIREAIDDGAHRARTAYLLAARRGEPAGEVAAIEHGMLTYVLLKGMGREGLKPVPGLAASEGPTGADRDHDGLVSTDELRWFADLTLPRLALTFPPLVQVERAGAAPIEVRPAANLGQEPRMQSSGAAFPLVVLPEGENSGP